MSAPRIVHLSLGSNVGDRRENLRTALRLLTRAGRVAAVASLYETAPSGVLDQPPFLNSACAVDSALPLRELLQAVKRIEWECGRRPAQVWGPRPLDIDILLAGDETVDTADLQVPHPRFAERGFQLLPLAEIAPDALHPRLGATLGDLASTLSGEERQGVRRVAAPEWATD